MNEGSCQRINTRLPTDKVLATVISNLRYYFRIDFLLEARQSFQMRDHTRVHAASLNYIILRNGQSDPIIMTYRHMIFIFFVRGGVCLFLVGGWSQAIIFTLICSFSFI